jgi:LuxR family transcriptional activator of conjugal transfer of Ti plasmids
MHCIFQKFIDLLSTADDPAGFSEAMASTAAALELSNFAYLALPDTAKGQPRLISTYPPQWTAHYLKHGYQRIDPIITEAIQTPEPFRWGTDVPSSCHSPAQRQLLDEASAFGIRIGFTVPIHDGRGPVAALTFATDRRKLPFEECVASHARVLQLMAMYFHAHVRRKLCNERSIDGIVLSSREFQCLEWASQGKSAWETGQILGISHYTVASYLSSAKDKLGVRTVLQAVSRLAAAKREKRN